MGRPPGRRAAAFQQPTRPGSCPRSFAYAVATWWSPFVDAPPRSRAPDGINKIHPLRHHPCLHHPRTRRSRSVQLDIRGEHYTINLMVPLFNPGPIANPDIPIHVAAVNEIMCRTAGEVADGLRAHPVCTPSYIEQVMLPAVRKGAARAGRSLQNFSLCMKPLVATAHTEQELVPKVRDARARIAFYASTPGYVAAFEHLGLGEMAREAAVLSKAQRWEELPDLIDDRTLHQFVCIGTYDEIGARLTERYRRVVTDIEFSMAVQNNQDRDILRGLAAAIQRDDEHE